ncbi:ferredoxin reductase domain-containing protein [Thiosocius teredinicola]|uniref:hypothetical protein n=1 Tax=Thiosocius teredinicola TaxID=1973002 RepID=UPI000F7B6F30
MSRPEMVAEPIAARIVHKSEMEGEVGSVRVIKMMLNLMPAGRKFEAGSDIAFLAPGYAADDLEHGLRHFTIEAVGRVPFEDSVDLTIYVRDVRSADKKGIAQHLAGLNQGDSVQVYGPAPYPFYPPMGSRSNVIMIGAGTGMVPFRWLALKIQQRKLDWMGKVLMLEGNETGVEHLYANEPGINQDQYFDAATYRAFEALKTRYSATASDSAPGAEANMEAMWRLMGQGSVFVYLAGHRSVAKALDEAMSKHLRLAGRWDEAKAALKRDGHWLEYLYD